MIGPLSLAIEKLRRYALARVESDTTDPWGRFTRAFAVAIALALVASMVAPVVAIGAVGAAEPPSGMTGVPDGNVASDLPSNSPMGESAEQLANAGIMASDNSGTLEVIVTSPGRSKSKYTGGTLHGDGPVALVFRDTEVSAGREVAVPADALEDVLGKKPTAAFGTHTVDGEDVGEWAREIRYEDGYAIISIEEFSSNSVTFTGGVSISATNANDGSTFTYSVTNDSTVGNYTIDLTGRKSVANTSRSGILATGESYSISPGGTKSPENAQIEVSGVRDETNRSVSVSDGSTVSVGGNVAPENEEITLTGTYSESPSSSSGSIDSTSSSLGLTVGGSLAPSNEELTLSGFSGFEDTTTTGYNSGSNFGGIGDTQSLSFDVSSLNKVDEISLLFTGNSNTNADMQVEVTVDGTSFGNRTFNSGAADYNNGGERRVFSDSSLDVSGTNSVTMTVTHVGGQTPQYDIYGVYSAGSGVTSDHYAREDASSAVDVTDGSGTRTLTEGTHTLDLSSGDPSVTVPSGTADYSASWTERTGVTDPSVTIDGKTVSHTGVLDGSTSSSITLSTGTHTVSQSLTGDSSALSTDLNFTEVDQTEDPIVDVSDGTTVAHTGLLDPSQTVSKSVTLAAGSTYSITQSGGTNQADINVTWTEVSESKDPAVTVNGNAVSHTGVLAEGTTTSLSTDPSWVVDGENTVSVSMAGANGGPSPEVGLEYQHEAGVTSTSFDYSGETWSERYNISHTFVGNQTGATLTLPFDSERVIGIKNLEIRENGGTWSSVPEADYSLNGTELTVKFGDVVDGDSVEVRATGTKIKTYDATMNVLEPTVESDILNTRVEFTQVNADLVGIDVSGTQANGEIHYVPESSFNSETYAEAMSNGDQILRAPGVGAGSTMTVSTVPMDVTPESGAMEVVLEDPNPDRPRFILREGGTVGASNVEVEYTNTLSGERYVLWSETEGREVDADRAESPVYFVTDGSTETYSIFQKDASTGGGGGSGGGVVPVESSGLSSLIVVPVVAISIGGLWLLGRRFGGDSARGVRGNAALLVGGTIIAIVAAELVTPRSLTSDITFALGDALASGAGAVILGLAVLVGLWAINQRTSATIPNWLLGVAGFLVVVMSAEAIRPGSLLGVISGAIAEVGAAVVLIGLIAVAAIMYRRASTPSNKIVFDSGDE